MMRRTLALVVTATSLGAAGALAQSPRFRYERPIQTEGTGPHRLAVDAGLLLGSTRVRDNRLSDLRLFEVSGREVPYLFVLPDNVSPQWLGTSLAPIAATEKTSGFEADLGAVEVVDSVQVDGLPAPFLKRLVLEGSGDRERWTLLAAEGTLFDLPAEQLRQKSISFAPAPYRFLRVTWNDTNSGRLPLPRAVLARRAPVEHVEPPPVAMEATFENRPSEPGRSRYRVRLPAPGLPVVAVTLEVGGNHVFRNVAVTEAHLLGSQAVPREIGRATISRVVRDGMTAAALRIPLNAPPNEQVLDLVVDDGSNPPLALTRVVLELARFPWIYFEATGSPLVARYGDASLPAPRYDLEATRESILLAKLPDARWGEAREMTAPSAATAPPAPPMPDAGAAMDPDAFRFRRKLPDSPSGLVAVPLDASVLANSRGAGRVFEDVRIIDDSRRQIPYLLERQEEPLSLQLSLQKFDGKAPELRTGDGTNRSAYVVKLPYSSLPNATLVLETSARVFTRTVSAGVERPPDRNRRDTWFETIATQSWLHKEQDIPAPALSLPLGTMRDEQIVVVVDEGDNSPLPVTSARLLLPSYRVRFFHPGRAVTLVYGRDDVSQPRYDLALLATHVMGAEARELVPEPAEEGSAGPVTSLVSPKVFWAGLVVAVLIIGGIIVRLMRA